MERYYVYILLCIDDSYYVGVTNNLELRYAEHVDGADPSCYTYKRLPVELVYVESFKEILSAIDREKQIKGWSRKKKEALIEGDEGKLFLFAMGEQGRRVHALCVMVRRAHHDTLCLATPTQDSKY